MVKKIKITIIILLFLFFLLNLYSQEEIEKYKSKLFKISQEISVIKEKLKEESKKESTLLTQLRNIELKKNLIQKEIIYYDLKLKQTESEIKKINKKINEIKKELDRKEESLKNVLVVLYKLGKFRDFQVLFSAKDLNTLLSGSKYISILLKLQSETINDYLNTIEKLKGAEKELRNKNEQIKSLRRKAQQKKKELNEQEIENKKLIIKIREDKNNYLRALEELKIQADKLKEVIKELAKEEELFPFEFSPIYEKKGSLNWPINGKVITFFGLQKHPVFKTKILNKGIEIAPSKPHSFVNAIYYGRVVFADYFKGYGNLIIIDHGLKYYSLYGYCADFLVEKGNFVRENQPIAIVGDVGSLKGECLYFELRYKTEPLNPLKWLKKR